MLAKSCRRPLTTIADPEVSTLSTLTNLQNSLFVPDLGNLINRRATYNLTRTPTSAISPLPLGPAKSDADKLQEEVDSSAEQNVLKTRSRRDSINSVLSESRYAVLPHGVSLDGWSDAEKQELNDYVRHLMHSRRAKFKRSMKGFGQYVRKRMCSLSPLQIHYSHVLQRSVCLSPSMLPSSLSLVSLGFSFLSVSCALATSYPT